MLSLAINVSALAVPSESLKRPFTSLLQHDNRIELPHSPNEFSTSAREGLAAVPKKMPSM